jgi:AAA domain
MTVTFRPAVREQIPLLLGLAGGTGSGKTYSALELAKGIAQGNRFAVIDSENGRAKHYADIFDFDHAEIHAPFRPQVYIDAISAATDAGYPVVVVDSASHEWYGDGGCLDWHDELMGGNQTKNLSAWIEPKREHKRLVTRLLQIQAHVILCFRAEPKVEAVRDAQGKLEIKPKASLVGLDGWIPIAEKNLPFELTASFLLMADRPGVPRPIKLPEQLKPLVSLSEPLSAKNGLALAEWAAGGEKPTTPTVDTAPLETELLTLSERLGKRTEMESAVEKHRFDPGFAAWLDGALVRARGAVATSEEAA